MNRRPEAKPPGEGEESVWDYPRPPALEQTARHLVVRHAGVVVAETEAAFRVLETSHPPVYYFPPGDVTRSVLEAASGSSFCEWKGTARYVSVRVGDERFERAGWYYPDPTERFAAIANYVAFYAAPFDECRVDGEQVTPQPGGFYGGWITSDVVGPFKGVPGSAGW